LILNKASFDSRIFFNVDIGIEQDLALSLALSALYLSPIFYIFEKKVKNLKIPVLLISFVDKGFFCITRKNYLKN